MASPWQKRKREREEREMVGRERVDGGKGRGEGKIVLENLEKSLKISAYVHFGQLKIQFNFVV